MPLFMEKLESFLFRLSKRLLYKILLRTDAHGETLKFSLKVG